MVDQLLGGLFGSQDDDDDNRRRSRAQDFIGRYEEGSPYEGYSTEEAFQNYQQVASRLSPEEYEDAAAEAFQRLSPQDRMQLAQLMQQQGGGQFGDFQVDDPRQLARMTSRVRQESGGGGLAALLGGGGGGVGDLLGAAMGGGQRRGGGGGGGGTDIGDLLNNPVAKAALAGIAAMAMKKIMR
jgi:hypothetical protein